MRILIASLRGASGIAAYTKSLATGLASAGHEVVLLDETSSFQAPAPRIKVVELGPLKRLPNRLEPFAGWSLRGEVRRLADEFAVDVVHATRLGLAPRDRRLVITAWDPIASPLGRLRAAPGRGEDRTKEAMYAVVDAVAARRARVIVAVTPAVKAGLDRFGRPCEFIPDFLPDEVVAPAQPHRPHDVVMVAANIESPRKGLDLALEAVSQARETIPEARLILVGAWSDTARQASLPGFCQIRGRLAPDQVRTVLAGAGCCVIPSAWEEFGHAGLEALSTGITVACTPLPAYEGLSGGGVFMASRREPAELSRQIVKALNATAFEFPAECRSSVAIPKLVDLYGGIPAKARVVRER